MSKEYDVFIEGDWSRVEPKWKFWNKQQHKRIWCTKCSWDIYVNRTYYSAMSASLAAMSVGLAMATHSESHESKKKKTTKKAATKKKAVAKKK